MQRALEAFVVFGTAVVGVFLALLILGGYSSPAPASAGVVETPETELKHPGWSFTGPFGTYDRAALQRGFQVYSEVCSQCHSMNLMYYRDLGPSGPSGGIGYTEDEVKAIAATPFVNGRQVTDGPNDQGQMFQRAGRPSDKFVAPFDHPEEASAAYGAVPPDLSVIAKAREGGPDYIYSVLTGYHDEPPPGVKMAAPNLQYNDYFPGHQIAMPPPLTPDRVTYADGTKATLDQEAHDVATFLSWASEPVMEDRKRAGAKVLIFLFVMVVVFFAAKRRVWADVH
jgi:ubiquinol-cytochrome c reductase cytochrome c1 subunit